MLRTSLGSASGPGRPRACASCLIASRRHVRNRRYYAAPAKDDENKIKETSSGISDILKISRVLSREKTKSSSTPKPSGDSTAHAGASKKPPTNPPTSDKISFSKVHSAAAPSDDSTVDTDASKKPPTKPPTSEKISFSKVLTRDIFKATNPDKPEEQQKQPKNAGRKKPKRRKISTKAEEENQTGGENNSSTKKSEGGKHGSETREDKPPKKPTIQPKKPSETKSRIKKIPMPPGVPPTRTRLPPKPRAKPPKLTARQAGKKSSRGAPARKPMGPPQPLNIKIESTTVDGLQKGDIDFKALDYDTPPVPTLSFGLDRVLFNPGVYHLRDPRSRVYNFDPDLGTIMPVTEFDFNTLKEYITSSKDETLIALARKAGKKYVGSSSSMTSVLSHFHYLLSNWRPLKQDIISRGFEDSDRQFTRLLRGPSAMFLHYKDGVYAIDADKEFDSANILMNLGKSMEKQLTIPKEQFERYRRSAPNKITQEEENAIPESYHYSTLGDFVMRSQLDAYDPRLPGSGMFDLKTRAVVSIRMSVQDYEQGLGYEIRNRFGAFESFEREYYDMIRAAFLKYSLQVRIGRMDGIFVAFHNIERIFGFQYVPLSEMDYALHGQTDTKLGDREFQYSIKLWNKILNKVTAKFPKQSLRLHFETLESRPARMMVFAQPVTDDQIRAIQEKNKEKIEKAQQQMLYPDTVTPDDEPDLGDAVDFETEAVADADVAVGEATTEPEKHTTTTGIIENHPVLETETEPNAVSTTPKVVTSPQQDLLIAISNYINISRNLIDDSIDSINDIIITVHAIQDPNTPLSPTAILNLRLDLSRKAAQGIKAKINHILLEREAASLRPKLFGMEISIQNLLHNRRVDRPHNLLMGENEGENDWKVIYTINEFEMGDSGLWNHFLHMKNRRAKALSFEKKRNADDYYLLNLRRLAKQGKKFREEQDRIDKEQGIVVYEELREATNSSSGSSSSSSSGKESSGLV